jgi:hypothetical protein
MRWIEFYTQGTDYSSILSAKSMLNNGICNMNVPHKIFHQNLSTVLGAQEPNKHHNFTETVTTNKTVRMTGSNFFSDP